MLISSSLHLWNVLLVESLFLRARTTPILKSVRDVKDVDAENGIGRSVEISVNAVCAHFTSLSL